MSRAARIGIIALAVFIFLPALSSCGPGGPEERLNAYCIRECVINTSDSEICDTRCNCAVDKLSAEMSRRDFLGMVNRIAKNDNPGHEYAPQLKDALDRCKAIK